MGQSLTFHGSRQGAGRRDTLSLISNLFTCAPADWLSSGGRWHDSPWAFKLVFWEWAGWRFLCLVSRRNWIVSGRNGDKALMSFFFFYKFALSSFPARNMIEAEQKNHPSTTSHLKLDCWVPKERLIFSVRLEEQRLSKVRTINPKYWNPEFCHYQ